MNVVFCKAVLIIFVVSPITAHKRSKRLVEGQEAISHKHPHPWFVVLKIDKTKDLKCGGTIIDKLWVLTAAHCINGQKSIFLEFGTDEFDHNEVSMTANEFFIHPQYNTRHNDVALIKLPTALSFSKKIYPISLVSNSDRNNNFEKSHAYVYGYGTTDDLRPADFSKHLLYAVVTVINNQQCLAELKNEIVIESTLCTKGFNGGYAGICRGDSGGPLITTDSQGKVIQIGISSFAKEDDCMSGFPSGFARLTFYLEFIHSQMAIESFKISTLTLYITFSYFIISHGIFVFLTRQIMKDVKLNELKHSLKIICIIYFLVFIFYLRAMFKLYKKSKLVYT